MLGWFVNRYVNANILTPTSILVLFIVSVLALAWVVFTIISYVRARHDALLVAFIDLCFVGAFIAGVVLLRYWGSANCSNLSAGLTTNGSYFNLDVNKQCAMLKASFALGIIDILNFFVTVVSRENPTCSCRIELITSSSSSPSSSGATTAAKRTGTTNASSSANTPETPDTAAAAADIDAPTAAAARIAAAATTIDAAAQGVETIRVEGNTMSDPHDTEREESGATSEAWDWAQAQLDCQASGERDGSWYPGEAR